MTNQNESNAKVNLHQKSTVLDPLASARGRGRAAEFGVRSLNRIIEISAASFLHHRHHQLHNCN